MKTLAPVADRLGTFIRLLMSSNRDGEKDFVADMMRWTTRGGQPTEKQAKWLRSIYVRVR
jgi:hypothetical protein